MVTTIFDYFCQYPDCGRGYLGSARFLDGPPPEGMVFTRGKCPRCRRWQWVDCARGVLRPPRHAERMIVIEVEGEA
jgi:hypothetical protein